MGELLGTQDFGTTGRKRSSAHGSEGNETQNKNPPMESIFPGISNDRTREGSGILGFTQEVEDEAHDGAYSFADPQYSWNPRLSQLPAQPEDYFCLGSNRRPDDRVDEDQRRSARSLTSEENGDFIRSH